MQLLVISVINCRQPHFCTVLVNYCYCKEEMFKNNSQLVVNHTKHAWSLNTKTCMRAKNSMLTPGSKISSITVRRKLHEMGFNSCTATNQLMCGMQKCEAHHYWTLEQLKSILWSDGSLITICQPEGCIWICQQNSTRPKAQYQLYSLEKEK